MQKLWSGLRIVLALCFAPIIMGVGICLLFFPPTWVILWFVANPKHQDSWLKFKIAVWEEWWHIRGLIAPQNISAQTRGLYSAHPWGDAATVKLLLERGADPNANCFYGTPLLVQAAEGGHTLIVKTLLEAGANSDARTPVLRYTALIQAARGGFEDTVSCLLEHGADCRAMDVYGNEALMAATIAQKSGAVRVLLEHCRQEPALPPVCRLALALADKQGNEEISKMLREAGVVPLPKQVEPVLNRE